MDLELTDEQTWLSESIDTLLAREWVSAEQAADAGPGQRQRVWDELVAFGALCAGGDEGLGAIELCLIARSLGANLASVPFLASAAVRFALVPCALSLPEDMAQLMAGEDAIAIALVEAGCGWGIEHAATTLQRAGGPAYSSGATAGFALGGAKVAVEHAEVAGRLAVIATLDGQPALAIADGDAAGLWCDARSHRLTRRCR